MDLDDASYHDYPQRVLVCLRYGIGDVVMELPALRALRADWRHAHLCALGAWPALQLLDGDPMFQDRLGIQAFGFRHWGDDGNATARHELALWLDAQRFDCVIDASHAPSGVRHVIERLGLPTRNTGSAVLASDGAPGGAARSVWREAVRAWGLDGRAHAPVPALYMMPAAREQAAKFLVDHDLFAQPLAGFAPNASSKLKRWPLVRVCETIERVHAEHGLHALVFGISRRDHDAIEQLERRVSPQTFTRVEPMHLQQTAALISRCRVFLSNDTGLMHIASAIGTPTVGLFGPTSARVALPGGATAVSANLPCRHRLEDRFGPPACVLEDRCLVRNRGCIESITIDDVLAAIGARAHRAPWHNGATG